MTEFQKLVKQASKAAQEMGGLLAILLVIHTKRTSKVEWDPNRVRFKVNGKIIPITEIRKELSRIDLRIAAIMSSYNNKLWSKQWTVSKWRSEMEKLVVNSHIILGALAVGGIAVAVTNSIVVQRRTARDLTALHRFALAFERHLIVSLPQFMNRSRAYLRSFYVTHNLLSHRAHIEAGYTEAKRRLSVAEHCHNKGSLPGCYETAQRGWMPIRRMPPIGTLPCKQFCKCWILYR